MVETQKIKVKLLQNSMEKTTDWQSYLTEFEICPVCDAVRMCVV